MSFLKHTFQQLQKYGQSVEKMKLIMNKIFYISDKGGLSTFENLNITST